MNTYIISSEKLHHEYIKKANTIQEVIQWIENTLDLSANWTIELSKINL